MSDLNEAYTDLTNRLDELTEQHKELLALAEEQKEMILSRDSENLTIVVKKQESVLQSVRESEIERQRATKTLAKALELDTPDISLRDLIEKSEGKEREGLENRLFSLSRIVEELAIVNQMNARLISQAKAYDDILVQAVTGESESGKTYGPEGAPKKSSSGISLIDRKA